ncbi:MAG: hypothetical protein WCJ53_15375 [Mycobacteriaceae bacterium]
MKSAREFTNVFGTAADAGDATEVAPTNSPTQSDPITLLLVIKIAFPFRRALLLARFVAVMR